MLLPIWNAKVHWQPFSQALSVAPRETVSGGRLQCIMFCDVRTAPCHTCPRSHALITEVALTTSASIEESIRTFDLMQRFRKCRGVRFLHNKPTKLMSLPRHKAKAISHWPPRTRRTKSRTVSKFGTPGPLHALMAVPIATASSPRASTCRQCRNHSLLDCSKRKTNTGTCSSQPEKASLGNPGLYTCHSGPMPIGFSAGEQLLLAPKLAALPSLQGEPEQEDELL